MADDEHPLFLELKSLRASVARFQDEAHTSAVKLQRHSLDTARTHERAVYLERENDLLKAELAVLRATPHPDAHSGAASTQTHVQELTLSLRRLSQKLTLTEEALLEKTTALVSAQADAIKLRASADGAYELGARVRGREEAGKVKELELEWRIAKLQEEARMADVVLGEYAALVRGMEAKIGRTSASSSSSSAAHANGDAVKCSESSEIPTSTLASTLVQGKLNLENLTEPFQADNEKLELELDSVKAQLDVVKSQLDAEKKGEQAVRAEFGRAKTELEKLKIEDASAAKMVARYMQFSQTSTNTLLSSLSALKTRHAATLHTLSSQTHLLSTQLRAFEAQNEHLRTTLDALGGEIMKEAYGRRREVGLRIKMGGREEKVKEGLRRWVRRSEEAVGRVRVGHGQDEGKEEANVDASKQALAPAHEALLSVAQDARILLESLEEGIADEKTAVSLSGAKARGLLIQSGVEGLLEELRLETERRMGLEKRVAEGGMFERVVGNEMLGLEKENTSEAEAVEYPDQPPRVPEKTTSLGSLSSPPLSVPSNTVQQSGNGHHTPTPDAVGDKPVETSGVVQKIPQWPAIPNGKHELSLLDLDDTTVVSAIEDDVNNHSAHESSQPTTTTRLPPSDESYAVMPSLPVADPEPSPLPVPSLSTDKSPTLDLTPIPIPVPTIAVIASDSQEEVEFTVVPVFQENHVEDQEKEVMEPVSKGAWPSFSSPLPPSSTMDETSAEPVASSSRIATPASEVEASTQTTDLMATSSVAFPTPIPAPEPAPTPIPKPPTDQISDSPESANQLEAQRKAPSQPLLAELGRVSTRYDDLQRAFRDCHLALEGLKASLAADASGSAASSSSSRSANMIGTASGFAHGIWNGMIPKEILTAAVGRLDDYTEDVRVELEIRVGDEVLLAKGFEALLCVPGALAASSPSPLSSLNGTQVSAQTSLKTGEVEDFDSEGDAAPTQTEVERQVGAFVDGTDPAVRKARETFERKLDDVQHDIAALKRAVHDPESLVGSRVDTLEEAMGLPGPASSSSSNLTFPKVDGDGRNGGGGWTSWIRGSPSRPSSPALPTFGNIMTDPRLRHSPSLNGAQLSGQAQGQGHPPRPRKGSFFGLRLGGNTANEQKDPLASLELRVPMPSFGFGFGTSDYGAGATGMSSPPPTANLHGSFGNVGGYGSVVSPNCPITPTRTRTVSTMYMLGLGAGPNLNPGVGVGVGAAGRMSRSASGSGSSGPLGMSRQSSQSSQSSSTSLQGKESKEEALNVGEESEADGETDAETEIEGDDTDVE